MQFNTSTIKLDTPIIRFDTQEQRVWKQVGALIHSGFSDDINQESFLDKSGIDQVVYLLDESGVPVGDSDTIFDDEESRYPILGYMGQIIERDSYPLLNAVYLCYLYHHNNIAESFIKIAKDYSRFGLIINETTTKRVFSLNISIKEDKGYLYLETDSFSRTLPYKSYFPIKAPKSSKEITDDIRRTIENIIWDVLRITLSQVTIEISFFTDEIYLEDVNLVGIIDIEQIKKLLAKSSKNNVCFDVK